MLTSIQVQTKTILSIVGILLVFKAFGILRSISSTFMFLDIGLSNVATIRHFFYFAMLIIPFIFLVRFFLYIQKSHRENDVLQLKDAFEQLTTYFKVLIGTQLLMMVFDLSMSLFNSL